MNKDEEKIQAALNVINARISSIETDKEWLSYLSFQSKFYNYSALNAMLIWSQNKEASYVMGFKSWNKLGRSVSKGEKAIKIFAPIIKAKELVQKSDEISENQMNEIGIIKKKVLVGFHLVSVFDLSQTTGDDSKLPILISGLAAVNPEAETEIYERMKTIISDKVPVIEMMMSAKGSYNLITNQISIREDISPLQKVKTLLHEFAHFVDYSINPDPEFHRNKRELIAESVAFIVSQHLGIDTGDYSISYIRSWLKDDDELKQMADTIQKISYEMIKVLALSDYSLDRAISA